MVRLNSIVMLVLAALLPAPAPSQPASSAPSVAAGPLEDAIHLDGVLDEPAWRHAGLIADLGQQSPRPGEPSPYHTEVRVLVGPEGLYIGAICSDPEPERIAVHTMQRDGNMRGDDSLAFVFDTFGDRRTGYAFRINVADALADGLISGPDGLSLDWDGIWNAATRRTPTGWSAEIAIPARSLQFRSHLTTWGFNIERTVARDRTVLRWAGATLDGSLYDFSRAGSLTGVGGLKQGLGLSTSPYALARRSSELGGGTTKSKGDGGVDVTYSPTPGLAAVVTVNTDFAETEVDTRQINLTRFSLFFPEKRPFFLEGSNQLEFARGLGTDFIPFYSRRIGLFEGQPVPLDAGLKLAGHLGRWGLSVLDVRAGNTPATRSTNLFAGRVTAELNESLRLGATITHGDPTGAGDNSLVGLDAVWHTSRFRGDKNFNASLWAASSTGNPTGADCDAASGSGEPADCRRTGWGVELDYPNDLWDLSAQVSEFGDALNPTLGFLPRPGTRRYEAGAAFQPRPSGGAFSWVRQFFFETFLTRVDDLHGKIQSWRVFTAPLNVSTQAGEHLEANWAPQFEFLPEPFEIVPGLIIPEGSYHFARYRAEAQSSSYRPWRVGATVWFGGFYSGRLTQWEQFANWTSHAGHVQLKVELENDFGHLPEGNFVQRLWQIENVYAFTPDLILGAFIQYDSESRNLGTNTRLRWTLRHGRDLFVVWNRGWRRPLGGGTYDLDPLSDQILVKLRWTIRA